MAVNIKRIFKWFLIVVFCLILLGAGSAVGVYYWAAKDLPRIESITDYNPALATTVYTENGEVLGYLSRQRRFFTPLKDMSRYVPRAFLASEDSSFNEHSGVDLIGIFRAVVKNMKAGRIVQGGSTITQQVVKSLLLSSKRTYKRKLKEAILAYKLEKHLTKDEILTIYLNQIYMGSSAYGVEAAAREFFAKHASELNLAESALLAGLPKSPGVYNPYKNPELAKSRQEYVLKQMFNLDWITREEYKAALDYPLKFETMTDPTWKMGAHYLEEVRRWALDRFGEKKTYTGGLNIYTVVNKKHQKAAEEALQEGLVASTKRRGWRGSLKNLDEGEYEGFLQKQEKCRSKLKKGEWIKVVVKKVSKSGAKVGFANSSGWMGVQTMDWCREIDPSKAHEEVPDIKDARKVLQKGDVVWASLKKEKKEDEKIWQLSLEQKPKVQGALVSFDPRNGNVKAMVGGYNFQKSQYNRATQARRQPGSAFKPIVYSAALDNGFTPASMILDAPIVYSNKDMNSTWKPQNYERQIFGPTLLRTALVKSRNLVTIRIANEIGINRVIDRAKSLGIKSEFPSDLSVSLGSASVTLMNLSRAYSAFCRGGSYIQPRLVNKVTDPWEKEIYKSETMSKEAISSQTAYIINNLLQKVIQDGTGWRIKALDRPVAGKTGTSDEQKDAWFMGYAPYLLTGVYIGFDDPRTMGKYETGSRAAAPIWLDYRQEVEDNYPEQDFEKPAGIVMARVDAENGLLASSSTEKSYLLPFKAGTQPSKISRSGQGSRDEEEDSEQQGDKQDKQQDKWKSLF
ncbi:MAG: penicillin-binding protein 1A [Thermodesulfobacteriota bacterium]